MCQKNMSHYSLSVALFDFLPVLLAGLGLVLLARGVAARHRALAPAAWAAALLIPFGGLCKASWKLMVATQQLHLGWLENLLFISLAPGFVLMAFSLFHARRAWQAGVAAAAARYPQRRLLLWLALPLLGALVAVWLRPETRLWFFWLLGITTIANAALMWQAIAASRWAALGWPVQGCLAYNFAATLALSGLSRLPYGEATAWLQEGVNFSAQAALAFGFWRLARRMQENP